MPSIQRTAFGYGRRRACAVAVILVGALPAMAGAQSVHPVPPPEVRAVPLTDPITLDGRLDEAVWRDAPAATDFLQSEPNEGEAATQRTEVRFAYDDVALYIGARMYDDLGVAGVRSRLVRRDAGTDGDELIIVFDTYHDHLGRTEFRRFTKPTRYYRWLNLIAGAQRQFNYDGDLTDREFNIYVGSMHPSYWEWSVFYIHLADVMDERLTRGGPVVERPGGGYLSFSLVTDSRRPIVFSTNMNHFWRRFGKRDWTVGVDATYRPAPNVSLTLGPTVRHAESVHQYVGAWEDPTATEWYGRRYLFADLEQRTLSMDTRLNVTFTPTLSLELFAQPLISGARFSRFKEFAAPRTSTLRVFGEDFGTFEIEATAAGRIYTVDADGADGPAPAFTFRDPDFNFRSLRGNAVLRWEYRPGSTLFLVWTQDRNDTAAYGDVRLRRDGDELLRARPDNIFLVKVSYWLGL